MTKIVTDARFFHSSGGTQGPPRCSREYVMRRYDATNCCIFQNYTRLTNGMYYYYFFFTVHIKIHPSHISRWVTLQCILKAPVSLLRVFALGESRKPIILMSMKKSEKLKKSPFNKKYICKTASAINLVVIRIFVIEMRRSSGPFDMIARICHAVTYDATYHYS